ncbi:unnamed protein product [Prorocentrum cordatum]|nr:unnamed protein product [Polarella glacialis]
MQKRGISHVLICHPSAPERHAHHFAYARVPLVDHFEANLLELLPEALRFLCAARAEGRSVFVFCLRGVSRSASCVIALLMFERGLGFDEAWRLTARRRPSVYPNVGFQQQLRHLQVLLESAPAAGAAPLQERLHHLAAAVPRGQLAPGAAVDLCGGVCEALDVTLGELQRLVAEGPPAGQDPRRTWLRHWWFFDNLRRFQIVPADAATLHRAQLLADELGRLAAPSGGGASPHARVREEIVGWVAAVQPLVAPAGSLVGTGYCSSGSDEERPTGGGASKRPRLS